MATYHFQLGHLAPEQQFTFHKRGQVHPLRPHTEATFEAACADSPGLLGSGPARITHFVDEVAADADDGVVLQSVRTPVQVDGPQGPGTQTYSQLVTYSVSVPGADSWVTGFEELACALLFMHNNLANLSSTDGFAIPTFVLTECIKPYVGDLAQQLSELALSGDTWISDPYPVMLSPTEHLVYPPNGGGGGATALQDDPDLWRAGRDPSIERLLTPPATARPWTSIYQPGDWVYSQRLNAEALQPALSSCLAAALRAAKNAPELQGTTWSVQESVPSSTYGATPDPAVQGAGAGSAFGLTAPPPTEPGSAVGAPGAQDSGDVTWTVTDLSPGSGLSVDASSLVVDMSKDTDHEGYAGQLTLACTNHWLRHLSAYVQFLKYQGEGDAQTLVPIDLGASDTPIPNPVHDPKRPFIYVNTTWYGDFVDADDYLWNAFGFIEPDHTKKFLSWVSPTGTICGIPVPAAPTTLTVDYIPEDANVVRIMWGGLGRGPYDQEVCALGITLTAVFELALPVILLMYDAATVDSVALTETVWNHKGTMLNLAKTVVTVVMNAKLDAATMAAQDAEAIGKFLAESLLPDLLQTGCAYGVILMAQLAAGAVMESIPFLDIASLIFNGAITAAQLSQTIVEVVDSPFVFTTDVARTFDLTLQIDPDLAMHEFPPEAIGGVYRVSIAFSTNSTPAVVEYTMPATTWSTPIPLTFSALPAGGRIQVSVFMYSSTGWQAGQGQSAWVDAKGDGTPPDPATKSVAVTVTNNPPPLDEFSVYQFVEKTVLQDGARQWSGIHSVPPASQPVATQRTDTNITELNGLTICQDAGMLGYTYQANSSDFSVVNVSLLQNPQSAYAAATGLSVIPGLVYQRHCASDGSGLNFYLDSSAGANADQEAHLRRLSLVWTQQGGSQPPDLDPDPALSWGRFPFPMDRLAAFNDRVVGISYDTVRHSKIYVVQVPPTGLPLDQAPLATMISGPGTRVGLVSVPRAVTFGMLGQILVLEQGTSRIQAFDVNGNAYPCFDPDGTGVKQSTTPLANTTPETVWLDLAVEPQGYIYVLSFEGLGTAPEDYHLDLYLPSGAFLARTDDFAAANIAVDVIRDVYTLNYESLEGASTPEPSVSMWIPPVRSYTGTVLSVSGTSLVVRESPTAILSVSTDATTVVQLDGQAASFAAVKVGQGASAFGAMSSSGVLFATQLFVTTSA